jgi:predicted PurR-regulated permease PerM
MPDARTLTGLALLAIAGWLVYVLSPILTPFLAAALIAYVCNPAVRRLQTWHVPRVVSVVVVFAAFVALLGVLVLFLVPRIEQAIVGFIDRLPGYLAWVQANAIPYLNERWGADITLDTEALRAAATAHWRELGNALGQTLHYVTQSGVGIVMTLVNVLLIPVVTFYLLLDWDRLLAAAERLLPPSRRASVRALARETDAVLASFLRGQLSVMAALATVYSAGLMIVGLGVALPVGIVAGLVSFVPYLGFITGITAASVAAYLQFHDAWMLVWVAVVFGIGQALEGMVLTPRLVGDRIGLHPVAVIFSVMAGGQLFGFIGVLLALPTAAVLKVVLAHVHEYYVHGDSASAAPPKASGRTRAARRRT